MSWTARLAGWVALIAAAPVMVWAGDLVPFMTRSHLVFLAINALAAVGLTLIMGFAGQVSLGHAAFYGIGAYSSAVLTVDYGWPPIAAIVAGVLLAGVVAAAVARSVFRAQEHFLAMATLAFGLIFFYFLTNARDVTGGNAGRGGIDKLALGPWEATTDLRMFGLVWGLLVLGVVLARNIVDSRTGRALQATGASEVAAASSGVDLIRAKVAVFAVGGMYAAIAGSLYAHYVTYVAPDEFGLLKSITFLIIVVVGGLGSVYGAVVGSVALVALTELGREVVPRFVDGATGPYELTIYGLTLVIVLLVFHRGLAGSLSHAWANRRREAIVGAAEPEPQPTRGGDTT
jgi:branched-chain amino acid transport system permease protein